MNLYKINMPNYGGSLVVLLMFLMYICNPFYILMQKCICRAFIMYIVWIGLTTLLPVHKLFLNHK